jgi:hypothetical protein
LWGIEGDRHREGSQVSEDGKEKGWGGVIVILENQVVQQN